MNDSTATIAREGKTIAAAATRVTVSAPLQLAAAALLGGVVLFGVGFANAEALHNAAHDTRHASGFPCH